MQELKTSIDDCEGVPSQKSRAATLARAQEVRDYVAVKHPAKP